MPTSLSRQESGVDPLISPKSRELAKLTDTKEYLKAASSTTPNNKQKDSARFSRFKNRENNRSVGRAGLSFSDLSFNMLEDLKVSGVPEVRMNNKVTVFNDYEQSEMPSETASVSPSQNLPNSSTSEYRLSGQPIVSGWVETGTFR